MRWNEQIVKLCASRTFGGSMAGGLYRVHGTEHRGVPEFLSRGGLVRDGSTDGSGRA